MCSGVMGKRGVIGTASEIRAGGPEFETGQELVSSSKRQDRIRDLPSLLFNSHCSALPVLSLK